MLVLSGDNEFLKAIILQVLVPLTASQDRHVMMQILDVRSVTGSTTGDNVNIVCIITYIYRYIFKALIGLIM